MDAKENEPSVFRVGAYDAFLGSGKRVQDSPQAVACVRLARATLICACSQFAVYTLESAPWARGSVEAADWLDAVLSALGGVQ